MSNTDDKRLMQYLPTKLSDQMRSRRTCLLITHNIDDQLIFVEAMARVAPGTLILLAESSKDAMELMRRSDIVPNCIFLEFRMPGAEGFDFLRKVKQGHRLRTVPIVVHTDEYLSHIVKPLQEIGVRGIYSRPYHHDGVCNALHVYFNAYPFTTLN